MSRVQAAGSLVAVLFLIGACLGSGEARESCACRPEAGRVAAEPAPSPDGGPQPEPSTPAAPDHAKVPPAAGAAAAAAPAATLPDFEDPSWTRVPSRSGKYLVCWRSLSGSVPRNEDFELEVWVLRDGAPVDEALLDVTGWMPDHGHGMLRQTKSVQREDGSFRVEGMLLHMRGKWQLRFDVLEGSLAETAESVIEL